MNNYYNVPVKQYDRLMLQWQFAVFLLAVSLAIIVVLGTLAVECRIELSEANRLLAHYTNNRQF